MRGNLQLVEVARAFLDTAHRFRLLTLPYREKPIYSDVNHASVVAAIRLGNPQSVLENHRSHKRHWDREMNDILDRLNL